MERFTLIKYNVKLHTCIALINVRNTEVLIQQYVKERWFVFLD